MPQFGVQATRPWFRSLPASVLLTLVGLISSVGMPFLFSARVQAAPRREGDILQIFQRGRIYVVTNDDPALADTLLEGVNIKERKVVTLDDWKALPSDICRFVHVVYLINRQRLPADTEFPASCSANENDLWMEVRRITYSSSTNYEVTLSCPDAAWLRQAVAEFRLWKEAPRHPQKRMVRSLAVVPSSRGAASIAAPLLVGAKDRPYRAHLLPADQYSRHSPRTAAMDELILLDRSSLPPAAFAESQKACLAAHAIGRNETVVWKDTKPNGRTRIIVAAPTSDQLAEALRRYPDPFTFPETYTVLGTARDLRSVRRVAVVGVKQGPASEELLRRVSSRAATEIRSLDTFEVLERAGLSEVLGEVALGQAGITKAKDRARVRQMAAADALLLVEITEISGRTDYRTKHRRLTPWMAGPPSRPATPSRLRWGVSLPDNNIRIIAENALKKVVGAKSDEDYQKDMVRYNRETLPAWQRQMDQYNEERRNRAVNWEQTTIATSLVNLSGSLRLVDLTDGLVLWETTFTASENAESSEAISTVTTYGEDSRPGPMDVPSPSGDVPDGLIARAAESGLLKGFQSLRGTALLPASAALEIAEGREPSAVALSARILDVDGDQLIIGLGANDGVVRGDALLITLPDGDVVRAIVTRARPRTCDALFDEKTPASRRGKVSVGLAVVKEPDTVVSRTGARANKISEP